MSRCRLWYCFCAAALAAAAHQLQLLLPPLQALLLLLPLLCCLPLCTWGSVMYSTMCTHGTRRRGLDKSRSSTYGALQGVWERVPVASRSQVSIYVLLKAVCPWLSQSPVQPGRGKDPACTRHFRDLTRLANTDGD